MYLDPKSVCKIMAFMAIIMGLGLLFYIVLGFRYMFWFLGNPTYLEGQGGFLIGRLRIRTTLNLKHPVSSMGFCHVPYK